MDNKTMIKVINGMADKIDDLELWKSKLNDMDRILLNRIEDVEREIPDINQDTDITDRLNDRCDGLEAKNYQLKSELDGIYKILEMDSEDLQALQNEVFEGYTRKQEDFNKVMGEAHKTLERVKKRRSNNNE